MCRRGGKHVYFILIISRITAVPCPSLTDLNNGVMTCSLGDDGVPSYEDTCSFTCITGYELTGSDTRTCQSNGNWSGIEIMCSQNKGMCLSQVVLYCIKLTMVTTLSKIIVKNTQCFN